MNERDLRRPFELSDKQLENLVSKLSEITGLEFNEVFSDNVNNFIGILRQTQLIEGNASTNKEIKRQLTQLRGSLQKVIKLQESMQGDHAGMMHMSSMSGGMEEYVNASMAVEALLAGNEKAIQKVDERARAHEFRFMQVQQAMVTELARELAAFGINITAYRDGIFEKCARVFLEAFNGSADGKTFRIYVSEDLFQTIQKAKDDHTKPERFFLLNFR